MTVLYILAGLFVLWLAWGLCTSAARGDELIVVKLAERERIEALVRLQEKRWG